MRIKHLNHKAFTLLEVLLASVIFVVSVAGIFATLNAVRGPVSNKENQLIAAVFGKQVLQALYSQVTDPAYYAVCGTSPCPTFDLSLGTHQVPHGNLPGLIWPLNLKASNNACDGANGCLVYKVSCADGSGACGTGTNVARRVDLNIDWPTAP
jgi:Tfp pilus assembly protein PilV